mmetsp:Transcript_5737/g.9121  ORF Transcript_5737/g.9121 Transcript_5737/m.9121 type:complete len:152 (-) Transcript_5737:337-792(-)
MVKVSDPSTAVMPLNNEILGKRYLRPEALGYFTFSYKVSLEDSMLADESSNRHFITRPTSSGVEIQKLYRSRVCIYERYYTTLREGLLLQAAARGSIVADDVSVCSKISKLSLQSQEQSRHKSKFLQIGPEFDLRVERAEVVREIIRLVII